MSEDGTTGGTDAEQVRAMAAEYLRSHSHLPFDPELKYTVKEEMEKWEEKRKELSEDDPLYEASEKAYEENKQQWLRILDEENGERKRFLELMAESFVAEGVWLEPRVIQAVNLVLQRECREWLVVDGTRLENDAELDDEQNVQVSTAVREIAEEELSTTRDDDATE